MSDRREYYAERYQRRKANDPTFLQRQAEANRRYLERKAISMAQEIAKAQGIAPGNEWELHQGYKAAERGQRYDQNQSKDWQIGWRIWMRRHGKAA